MAITSVAPTDRAVSGRHLNRRPTLMRSDRKATSMVLGETELVISDPWIQQSVGVVGQQVDGDDGYAKHQGDALHHRIVTRKHRSNRQVAHTRNAEHGLNHY